MAKQHGWTGSFAEHYDGYGAGPAVNITKTDGTQSQFELFKYRAEDGGVLDLWVDLYGHDWLYVTGHESWYHWTGTHWAKDESLAIQRQIQSLLDAMNKAALDGLRETFGKMSDDDDDDKEAKKALKAMAEKYLSYVNATKRTKGRVASVEAMARAQQATGANTLNAGNVLNLRNGTLDLDNRELHPHRQEERITYCLDYDFRPEATAPRFEKFMQEILVKDEEPGQGWETDPQLVKLIQLAMGYSLTNKVNHEVMFWLSGTGGNGKSVLIKVIQTLLGGLAFSMNFANLGTTDGNYRIAKLVGKRIVFCTESPKDSDLAEELMKQIADGSELDAREIRGAPFNFRPQAKIWWAMNDRPLIKDTGNAIWRRLQLVPFNRSFTEDERDIHLFDKLQAELPGILNFALDGLAQLKVTGCFPESKAVKKALNEYRHESNPVAQWLDECTDPSYEPMLGAYIYADYERWCIRNGRKSFNSVNFGKELKKLGIATKRMTSGMHYQLRLRQALAEAQEAGL